MMPFSVLRIWGTGILSWAILAGGIYCLWEWSEQREAAIAERRFAAIENPPPATAADPVRRTEDSLVRERAIAAHEAAAKRYLLAGLGLLGLSFCGFLPITLLLGRPGLKDPRP